ncbi:MAG: hypothetical protein ACM3SY_01945 [Candidatus Omnitrophota bacterium]
MNTGFSDFSRYAITNNCKLYIHPECAKDLIHDKDLERRKIIQSKIKKYEQLQNPAKLTPEFNSLVGQKRENDTVDNMLLIQVFKCYVELLITEDKGILKKADKIKIQDKVLPIKTGLDKLKKQFEFTVPRHPILNHGSVRKIENRIDEPFFDSLKEDYGDFRGWFEKCLRQDRKCYSVIIDGKLSALLIYNMEEVEDHKIPEIFEKALKICTFKTNEDVFGLKIGELFLNKMFEFCIKNNIKYLYLTLFDKHKFLVGLLKKFGFNSIGFKGNEKEIIMIKNFKKSELKNSKELNSIKIHPFYSDIQFDKFVIPIKKEFYESLFKDSSMRDRDLFDKEINSVKEIQGNSIIKAYICKSKTKSLKRGDILLFYFSRELKIIEPIGILDKWKTIENLEELKSFVRGKTVFSEKQLEEMFETSCGNLLVIIFRLIYYLKKPIELDKIKNLQCFSNKFIQITKMPEPDYLCLKERGYFDERYIID